MWNSLIVISNLPIKMEIMANLYYVEEAHSPAVHNDDDEL